LAIDGPETIYLNEQQRQATAKEQWYQQGVRTKELGTKDADASKSENAEDDLAPDAAESEAVYRHTQGHGGGNQPNGDECGILIRDSPVCVSRKTGKGAETCRR
jgi:hypothetical protein